MKLSSRSQTPPFHAMDVLAEAQELARAGRDIIHMEVGEPSHPAPRAAQARLTAEMAAGAGLGYTNGLGIPELRSAIANLYRKRYGIDLDPNRVVVTAGSSAGFILSFLSVLEAGDRLGMVEPGYPCYRNISSAFGIVAVPLIATLQDRYQPTPNLLDKAGKLDALLLASPSNPTGTTVSRERMQELVSYCADAGTALISDEIYHGITYGEPAVSALEFTQETIVINSFSKYWSMTGWRIGWMIVPDRFVRVCQNLSQNLFICPCHASQVAALGALSDDGMAEVLPYIEDYAESRQSLMTALPVMGFQGIAPSDGAFYIYADISGFGRSSAGFCREILHDAGVAITPGLDFDPVRGTQTVRLSYAQRPALIRDGIERMARLLAP